MKRQLYKDIKSYKKYFSYEIDECFNQELLTYTSDEILKIGGLFSNILYGLNLSKKSIKKDLLGDIIYYNHKCNLINIFNTLWEESLRLTQDLKELKMDLPLTLLIHNIFYRKIAFYIAPLFFEKNIFIPYEYTFIYCKKVKSFDDCFLHAANWHSCKEKTVYFVILNELNSVYGYKLIDGIKKLNPYKLAPLELVLWYESYPLSNCPLHNRVMALFLMEWGTNTSKLGLPNEPIIVPVEYQHLFNPSKHSLQQYAGLDKLCPCSYCRKKYSYYD